MVEDAAPPAEMEVPDAVPEDMGETHATLMNTIKEEIQAKLAEKAEIEEQLSQKTPRKFKVFARGDATTKKALKKVEERLAFYDQQLRLIQSGTPRRELAGAIGDCARGAGGPPTGSRRPFGDVMNSQAAPPLPPLCNPKFDDAAPTPAGALSMTSSIAAKTTAQTMHQPPSKLPKDAVLATATVPAGFPLFRASTNPITERLLGFAGGRPVVGGGSGHKETLV